MAVHAALLQESRDRVGQRKVGELVAAPGLDVAIIAQTMDVQVGAVEPPQLRYAQGGVDRSVIAPGGDVDLQDEVRRGVDGEVDGAPAADGGLVGDVETLV